MFRADNLIALWERVPPAERLRYPFALHHINWEEYLSKTHFPGIRKCAGASRRKPSLSLSSTIIALCMACRTSASAITMAPCALHCFLARQEGFCGQRVVTSAIGAVLLAADAMLTRSAPPVSGICWTMRRRTGRSTTIRP